jgi:cyclopropane fatty-acyl-phospholipid synthase-like methyltransferase
MLERIHAKKIFEHNAGDHVARYVWALDKIHGKTTLDCGCGEGYGTAWLIKKGVNIIGLDCSRYALLSSKINELILCDLLSIPLCNVSFEAVISFEVIEHLEDGDAFISKIRDILVPQGIFIGSTPIRKPRKYKNGKPKNPYHKKEYYIKEIDDLLKKHFETVVLYGQTFPSKVKSIFLSQLHKLKLLRKQRIFYPIHSCVTPKDEKCLWIAMKPKK